MDKSVIFCYNVNNNFQILEINKNNNIRMNYAKFLASAICGVAIIFVGFSSNTNAATAPQGWMDNCVSGWAIDADTPSQSITVHIYIDAPVGKINSGFVAGINTSAIREDVNTLFHRPLGEAHGFNWTPPISLQDGNTHSVYVYAIDTNDTSGSSNVLLGGSPKKCFWPSSTPSNGIVVNSPASGEQWQVGTSHTISWTSRSTVEYSTTNNDLNYSNYTLPRYTLQFELPTHSCLLLLVNPCKILQRSPLLIAQGVAGTSYQWNIPSDLPSAYISTGHILVTPDGTDTGGKSGEFSIVSGKPVPGQLTVTPTSSLTGSVGSVFSVGFEASGGTAPYSLTFGGQKLPNGLEWRSVIPSCAQPVNSPPVCASAVYSIVGTPTEAGNFPFTVTAGDSAGNKNTNNFTISVLAVAPIANPVHTGYVDVANGQRVEGWAFDQSKPGACVIITYRQTVGGDSRFTQDVCPTITRTDVADWIRSHFGNGVAITQPLGFRADPTQVLKPGTYTVNSVVMKDSGVGLELGSSAKFPITIADTTVARGPIVVSSPAKGETWQVGQTKTIAWSGNNNLPVKISLQPRYNCNTTNTACTQVMPVPVVIANDITGSSYAWTIPDTLGGNKLSGDNYYITLETVATGVDYVLWGQSGAFNIANSGVSDSPLFVSSPTAGAVIKAGSVTTIAWNVLADTQEPTGTIKYNYINNPACLKSNPPCAIATTLESVLITSSAPNTGTYAWTVPAGLSGDVWVTVSMGGWTDDSGVFTVQDDVKGSSLVPGQIVKSSTGNTLYYVTSSGAKYAFSSLLDFTSRGFSLRSIESVSQSVLDAIPTMLIFARVSGVSFKYRGANTVYYLNPSYCKEGYLGQASLRSWGVDFSAIYNIATDEQYPECSTAFVRFKDNTVVRLANSATIYRYSAGSLHPFSSFDAFTRADYTIRDILIMNQAEKDLYSVGDAIN